MPGSSLVKFGVTECFYRTSTEAATGAASLKKPFYIKGVIPVQGMEDPGIHHEPFLFLSG
jgi:hypothetical protein